MNRPQRRTSFTGSYLSVIRLELQAGGGRAGLSGFGEEVETGGPLRQVQLFGQGVDGGRGGTITWRSHHQTVHLGQTQEQIFLYYITQQYDSNMCIQEEVVPSGTVVSDGTTGCYVVGLLNQIVSVNVPLSFHENFPSGSYQPAKNIIGSCNKH